MAEFNYNGEHSIDIGDRNTWDYYHMAPKTRPFVAEPSPKTEFVDVPGADGQLDYTEALTGGVRYGNRSGTWNFIVDNGFWDFPVLQSDILAFMHGKRKAIILADDPEYYYIGRLTVKCNFGNKDFSGIDISYNLDPYKYPLASTANKDWQWNELFSNTILYGKFNVYGTKSRNIINPNDSSVSVSITVTSAMTVEFNGETISLASGKTTDALTISPGDNYMVFNGTGQVTIDYTEGGKL